MNWIINYLLELKLKKERHKRWMDYHGNGNFIKWPHSKDDQYAERMYVEHGLIVNKNLNIKYQGSQI